MLKQSLEDSIKADATDKYYIYYYLYFYFYHNYYYQEASAKASAEEGKATAVGDLDATTKEFAAAKDELATALSSCMTTASDHEASVHQSYSTTPTTTTYSFLQEGM
eukprot:9004835-Heterocapsa_arctica.AAC.1